MAEPRPTEWPYPWQGIFTELVPRYIPANSLSECVNMYYTAPSILRSRGGFSQVYSGATGKITLIHYWENDKGLYYADDAAGLYKDGVAIPGPTSNITDMTSFMQGVGGFRVLVISEDGILHTWDGTDYTIVTKKDAMITAASFYGTGGLDDCTSGGTYTGSEVKTFVVEIDNATATPQTFRWSSDGGESWKGVGIAITGTAQTLEEGVTVTFGSTTGHALEDRWTFDAIPYPDIPQMKRIMTRWGRIFGFINDYLYWSAPFDETNWGGYEGEGDWLGIWPGEYGDIVDFIDIGGTLYVWKERALFAVRGDDPSKFVVELLTEFDSPIAHTVFNCKEGVAYATENGVYPLGAPASEAVDWTRRIEQAIKPSLQNTSQAVYSDELCAYLLMDGSDTVWVSNHHNRPDVWTQFKLPFSATCGEQGGGELYLGSADGSIYQYKSNDCLDDSSVFDVYLATADWDIGEKLYRKDISTVEGVFDGGGGSIATVEVYKNGGSSPDQTKVFASGSGDRQIFRYEANIETIKIKITYTALAEAVKFQGLALRAKLHSEVI
jgi:hypothetical protein